MKNIILIIIAVFAADTSMAQAQTGKITGIVKDENLLTQPGATVRLKSLKDTTYSKGLATDAAGAFSFADLPQGDYSVSVSLLNYKTFISPKLSLTAAKPQIDMGGVVLQQLNIQLSTITVKGKKPLVETKIDKVVVNVENSILASGNSALEILQRSPGISVENDGNISLVGKQGVTVLIDDKPTYLSQQQLASLLKATDGSAIKEIEIISNPSAKYDAAGTGGIINIKLKKNKNYGVNGSLNLGAGYGSYYKSNAGLNLNYRKNKVNLFGGYYYSNNKRYQDYFIDRENKSGNNVTYFKEESNAVARNISQNYKAGIDYSINDNNTIGAVYTGYTFHQNETVNTLTHIGDSRTVIDSSVNTSNQSKNNFLNNSINLNYRSTLDTLGQALSIDVDYSHFSGDQYTGYDNKFYQADFSDFKREEFSRNFSPYTINIKSAKADYVRPLTKTAKLELGAKVSQVETDNDLRFERLLSGNWEQDNSLSNMFLYNENINAGYVNFYKEFKSVTLQAGLRGEHTESTGNSISENLIVKRSYFNLFPSLFISQKLSPLYQLNFSYSRRIERPNYQDLNPFVYYLDQYTYGKGNPYLNPQYTNSFELTFLSKSKLNYSATFGYSSTTDAITEVILPDTANKSLYQTNENLAINKNYYLNINSSIEVAPFWTTNNSIGVFYSKFSSPNVLGQKFSSGKATFNVKTINNFTLAKSLSAELYGNYQSSAVYGIVKVEPRYSMDLGIRKSFGANNSSDLKLSVSDIFNTSTRKVSSLINANPYQVEYKNETRVVRLTFSHRFGSKNIKGAVNRQSGVADEKDRAGNSHQ